MKYLLYFVWYIVLLLSSLPLVILAIVTSLISWEGKYADKVGKLWDDYWDMIFGT